LVLIGLLLLAAVPVDAGGVRSWTASTASEFQRGTLHGTALDDRGGVSLAPAMQHLWGPAEGIVWAVQPDGAGGAFVALSGPGRVLHVAADGETELWYEGAEESLVTALAADPSGGVVFGLSPVGRVLRASGPGEVDTVAETPAKFVWTLSLGAEGEIWIGTGLPGLLLRVAPDGETSHVFESGDDPVRALAPLPGGGWILGTGGRGLVIRIAPSLRPFVLLDADQPEIVAVGADPAGTIYALAADGAKRVRGPTTAAQAGETPIGEAVRVVAKPPPGEAPEEPDPEPEPPARPEPAKPPKQRLRSTPGGVLYRIDPDGGTRAIWSTTRSMPFALLVAGADRLLVGTGDEGRVLMLDGTGRATRLLRIPSSQASALAAAPDGVLIGGSTDARVARIGVEPRPKGTYLSAAIDAGHVADWGRLRWEADEPGRSVLRLAVRSGNTAEPDETWSPWRKLERGSGRAGVQTGVPPARWLQVRVDLSARGGADSARLRALEVAYLPRNRAPQIQSLTVDPAGVVWVRGPQQSSGRLGPLVVGDPVARRTVAEITRRRSTNAIRKAYEAGARTFSWKAVDPDGDRLSYKLELQREYDEHWFPLVDGLTEQFFSWDARGMPDGLYRVRLTVDDAADNPSGGDLSDRRIGDLFRVDNTRPSVGELEVEPVESGLQVEFVALDPGGSVAALEVARDGGEWEPLYPLDGVADSAEERYELVIDTGEEVPAAGHSLAVRVTDSAGNLGGDLWIIP
jgi:hypothetical protein